ncbi:hypothetical protein HGRIS_007343 [Hohenbuehelia grisea]|uniref:Uncharacterized protein n=1 Tax=Hohenbuehelia grisea TaxID=104357 RepID=A0ABR3J4Z1_9AGAR
MYTWHPCLRAHLPLARHLPAGKGGAQAGKAGRKRKHIEARTDAADAGDIVIALSSPPAHSLPTTPQTSYSLTEPSSALSFGAGGSEAGTVLASPGRPAQTYSGDGTDYEVFVESIAAETVAFKRISDRLFVVNGRDSKRSCGLPSWYHVQCFYVGSCVTVVCWCPQAKDKANCVHTRYLKKEGSIRFPFSPHDVEGLELADVKFCFSVAAPGRIALQDRSVVIYESQEFIAGTWSCTKDGPSAKGACSHINLCSTYLSLMDSSIPVPDDDFSSALQPSLPSVTNRKQSEGAISNLPIPPPMWALLPNEQHQDYIPRVAAGIPPPPLILLTDASACGCQSPRVTYSPFLPVIDKECVVYTLTHAGPTAES